MLSLKCQSQSITIEDFTINTINPFNPLKYVYHPPPLWGVTVGGGHRGGRAPLKSIFETLVPPSGCCSSTYIP